MLPRRLARGLIWLYQHTLSPDHSWLRQVIGHPTCRFTPTCSVYSREVYARYGFWSGTWRTIKRVAKCHPWHPGGVDQP